MFSEDELSKNAMGGTELMKYGLQDRADKDLLDDVQIVVGRERELIHNVPKIYWAHNLADDPEDFKALGEGRWERYDKLVFVSYWQLHEFKRVYGFPYSKTQVLRNAIDPIEPIDNTDDTIRLIYTPTPHRGLDILLGVYEQLYQEFPNLHLDVFSSFKLYGWEERDKPFEKLFDFCRDHEGITYHGSQPNDVVREYVAKADIFAYPSTWQETSCLTAIEALSGGCICVTSNLAALPETLANFGLMYGFDEDKKVHLQKFYSAMRIAITAVGTENMNRNLAFQKQYIDTFYNWDLRTREWNNFLRLTIAEFERNGGTKITL